MTDMQVKLGHALLKSLVDMRKEKGDLSLEDVGSMFMNMASTINPEVSAADQFMHQEIARMAKYIVDAKQEIFAISTNDKAEAVIPDASQHLDEVIRATENATNSIMDAADTIQNTVGGVGGEKEKIIMDASIRIYDACTFQDITGQRITKVIKLLSNIEERISKLNGLFGSVEGFSGADLPKGPISEKDLLNGPQHTGQAASQSEIDALFASVTPNTPLTSGS